MKRFACLPIALVAAMLGCAPRGPVVDTGAPPPGVGGTISGTVRATEETVSLPARVVTAVNVETNARFETSTGVNGGYTLKVPAGRYRLDLELREGETLSERPDATDVAVGDIDAARDFVVTVRPSPR